MPFDVTEATFEALVLRAQKPVLVDFWAPWCGPCRNLGPLLHQVEKRYPDVAIAKVDIQQCPRLAARYNVSSIPNLVVFVGGEPVDSVLGLVPIAKIERMLDRHPAPRSIGRGGARSTAASSPTPVAGDTDSGTGNPLDAIIQTRGGR